MSACFKTRGDTRTETQTTLIEQLRHPDSHIRSRAALNLGNTGGSHILDALIEALYTEMDFFVREDITWALVTMGDAAVMPLIRLLQSENSAARHQAAHVLSKISDARAIDALIHALHDTDHTVVLKSAFALKQIGDAKAIPALIRLLGHENREIHEMLSRILEDFGDAAFQPVIQALNHDRWQVREHAVDILGMMGSRKAVPALIHALQDEVWQVRYAAVVALGHIGGTSVKNALQTMTHDPEREVRILVPEVMKRLR